MSSQTRGLWLWSWLVRFPKIVNSIAGDLMIKTVTGSRPKVPQTMVSLSQGY